MCSSDLAALRGGSRGQVIAIIGAMSAAQARLLAASHHGTSPAMAMLLDGPHWAAERPPASGQPANGRAAADREQGPAAADVLTAAGWRVVVVTGSTPLADAWRELHSPVSSGSLRSTVSTEAPTPAGARLGVVTGEEGS